MQRDAQWCVRWRVSWDVQRPVWWRVGRGEGAHHLPLAQIVAGDRRYPRPQGVLLPALLHSRLVRHAGGPEVLRLQQLRSERDRAAHRPMALLVQQRHLLRRQEVERASRLIELRGLWGPLRCILLRFLFHCLLPLSLLQQQQLLVLLLLVLVLQEAILQILVLFKQLLLRLHDPLQLLLHLWGLRLSLQPLVLLLELLLFQKHLQLQLLQILQLWLLLVLLLRFHLGVRQLLLLLHLRLLEVLQWMQLRLLVLLPQRVLLQELLL